ncbi:MAG: hypothetical protein HY681_07335 [Chloroflexi bacterium]|nr:hypothetical protein [Chloroflexota bacterium]
MKTERFTRPATLAALLLVALWATIACTRTVQVPAPTPVTETIKASMLVQSGDEEADIRWFRDVVVPKGSDAWQFTETVTQGQVESQYYALYRAHFVDSLFGVKGQNPKFWLLFVWSDAESKWEPLPVGADLFSLKEGHILAWYYADTTDQQSVPTVSP